MAVVRKVQSRVALNPAKAVGAVGVGSDKKDEVGLEARPKKVCYFCKSHTEPRYWDSAVLKRYLNDRGRIVPRQRAGTCAKHQRRVSQGIKHARHLAILPFTVKV